jgi:hypothetical protein
VYRDPLGFGTYWLVEPVVKCPPLHRIPIEFRQRTWIDLMVICVVLFLFDRRSHAHYSDRAFWRSRRAVRFTASVRHSNLNAKSVRVTHLSTRPRRDRLPATDTIRRYALPQRGLYRGLRFALASSLFSASVAIGK